MYCYFTPTMTVTMAIAKQCVQCLLSTTDYHCNCQCTLRHVITIPQCEMTFNIYKVQWIFSILQNMINCKITDLLQSSSRKFAVYSAYYDYIACFDYVNNYQFNTTILPLTILMLLHVTLLFSYFSCY